MSFEKGRVISPDEAHKLTRLAEVPFKSFKLGPFGEDSTDRKTYNGTPHEQKVLRPFGEDDTEAQIQGSLDGNSKGVVGNDRVTGKETTSVKTADNAYKRLNEIREEIRVKKTKISKIEGVLETLKKDVAVKINEVRTNLDSLKRNTYDLSDSRIKVPEFDSQLHTLSRRLAEVSADKSLMLEKLKNMVKIIEQEISYNEFKKSIGENKQEIINIYNDTFRNQEGLKNAVSTLSRAFSELQRAGLTPAQSKGGQELIGHIHNTFDRDSKINMALLEKVQRFISLLSSEMEKEFESIKGLEREGSEIEERIRKTKENK